MADKDINSPLLHPKLAGKSQVSLSIEEDSDPHGQSLYDYGSPSGTHFSFRNPYAFIGSQGFSVPETTSIDPFRNNTPSVEGIYEHLKIAICFPVAVMRLVLFGGFVLVGVMATKLALVGWEDRQNPMPRWRRRIMLVTRICARCILFTFGYHWIKRKGKPAPREIAPIVVSNHVSFIEPIFYFYELFPTMVSSESHDTIPVVGTIIRAMQVIYVDRFSSSSKKHAVSEIKDLNPEEGFLQWISTNFVISGGNYDKWKGAHFVPEWCICPWFPNPACNCSLSFCTLRSILGCLLEYVTSLLSFELYCLRGHISWAKLLFRMMTQFHNFMEVEYLPIVSPLDDGKESALQYAKRTRHAMATALNVAQTFHSYGDLMLLIKASQAKQPKPSAYMVEMSGLVAPFHVSSTEAVGFLEKFLSMSSDSNGRVTYNEFIKSLQLKPCSFSEEIFAFLDVEKSGAITFKQFLLGSVHVKSQALFRKTLELVFSKCSSEEVDIIPKLLEDYVRPVLPDMDENEIYELLKLFDIDRDGRISKDDFFGFFQVNPLLIALFSTSLCRKPFSKERGDFMENGESSSTSGLANHRNAS